MPFNMIDVLDLSLLQSARSYDLSVKAERLRSVSELEYLFFRIVRELDPDLFVEAGAKDGSTSRRARKYLPLATITAFEANPFTYRRFESAFSAGSGKISYLHRALSDADGEVTFNVRVVNGKPAADGQGSILTSQDTSVGHQAVTVNASRLDTFFPADTFNRCAIWMDVEGASRQVLKGATSILPQVDALFIEVQDRPGWENQWLSSDVMQFLADFDLMPICRDFQARYLYNILFLRSVNLRNDRVRLFIAEHLSNAEKTRNTAKKSRPTIWKLPWT